MGFYNVERSYFWKMEYEKLGRESFVVGGFEARRDKNEAF